MSPQESAAEAAAVGQSVVEQDDEPPSLFAMPPSGVEVPVFGGVSVGTSRASERPSQTVAKGRAQFYGQDGRARNESPLVLEFRRKHFHDVPKRDWDDWHWQARHRIRTREQLERFIELVPDEREAFERGGTMLPFAVTPYYLALLDPSNARQGLRRSVIPSSQEFVRMPGEADDPLAEESHTVVPGLVHRYPDRVLFLAVDYCTTYCRYCTRSRVVGSNGLTADTERWQAALDYIRRTPTIRDVLLSGGDPLSLSEDRLDWLLGELRRIPHVEFVRIGTKMPAVLPQRINSSLIRVLRKHRPLWISIHFLHPDECTPEAMKACGRLADAGIPLGSQTVLLKGVNADVETMKLLVHRLLMMRVRPYYLYQCDPISGSSHFRTTVDEGLAIIEGLRGHTTGYAVPTYVIDAPGGGGKVPLQPSYMLGREANGVVLRNFEGNMYRYTEGPVELVQAPEVAPRPPRVRLVVRD